MTIYDIASLAEVSASTVSRVLNNKPGVGKKKRSEIQALLEQYNFSPNETARGLVNQSTRMIGILLTDIRTTHHTDAAYYIERELSAHGYCSLLFNTGSDAPDQERYIAELNKRRVEGVFMIGSVFQSDVVKEAIVQYLPNIPVVMINGYLELPNVYSVMTDEQRGVADCVRLMVNKGRKHFAFVCNADTPSNRSKKQGFIDGTGICNVEGRLFDAETSVQSGYDQTCLILQEYPQADCFIYAVDLLATGGIRAMYDRGIAVPKDVAVIGIDNSIYTEVCNPRLTSLDNKLLESSITAAHVMTDCLKGEKTGAQIILVTSIVEREST